MTTITRQAAFSLLEGLTEKDFECAVRWEEGENRHIYCGDVFPCPTHGTRMKAPSGRDAPVTLLDVLAKWSAKWDDDAYYTIAEASHLLRLWQPLGFKTTLQQATDRIVWEDACKLCGRRGITNNIQTGDVHVCELSKEIEIILVATKSPEADLIEYLLSLNL